MLSSLLLSSTAVKADTADDVESTSTTNEVVIETGNTSNDTNSSTNQSNTVSGNDTIDNSSNTTTENIDEADAAESDFNLLDTLRESKVNWPWDSGDDDECQHENLNTDDVDYVHISDSKHELYYKCKVCGEYVASGTTEDCTSKNLTYKSADATHHSVSGTCDLCGEKFSYKEECNFVAVDGDESHKFCDKEGCLNVVDNRNTNPEITKIKAELVSGDPAQYVETITEGGQTYTAFDLKTKITATVKVEALNDETFDDIKDDIDAKLSINDEYQQMNLDGFDNGVATFSWTSEDMYADTVYVDGFSMKYAIHQKLKDGSRGKAVKSGQVGQELYYILRNIDTDKAVSNITGTVTDGAKWKLDDSHKWYSKNVSGHKNALTLTWEGSTSKEIDINSVKVAEVDANGKTISTDGIQKVKVSSDKRMVAYGTGHFFFITYTKYKLAYANTIQYTVPATVDGQHTYNVTFKFKNSSKEHTRTLCTYIDNTAPTATAPVYESEAKKLNGKYYNKAVKVSVDVADEHLRNDSAIDASGEQSNKPTNDTKTSTLSVIVKDGTYTVTGKIYDLAGNCTEINDEKNTFIVDTKAPVVKKINYSSDASRLNDKYYKDDVAVYVDVEDEYLSSKSHIEVAEGNSSKIAKDEITSDTLKLNVTAEGEYVVTGKIYDMAGNCTEINDKANEFIIDKTAPTIAVAFDNNNAKQKMYYNAFRTAELTITEKYFSEAGVKVEKGDSKYTELPELQKFTTDGIKNISKLSFNKDGHYGFTVVVTDLAGNESQAYKVDDFVIDTVAPKVTINFDNNEFKHEKYYKANRTATVVLEDEEVFENLSSAEANINSGITVQSKYGTPTFNGMSGSSSKFTGTILFDQDGEYQISKVDFYDKAGNKAVVTSETDSNYNAEFVIDKTAPVIDVTFDNNNAMNGIYFKDERTAELTFKEKNFTSEQVTIKKNSGEQNPVPSFGGYTQSDINNITHIKFDKDGRYGFTVSCEDLAGNLSNVFTTDDFVIDMTLPELEITGVEDMSSNNGRVVPVIRSKDANLTAASTEISLTGSNRGKVSPNMTTTKGAETFTYEIADLAHDKSNDDLYTLSVKLTDLAGNKVEKTYKYSLNRFGSIFVLSDATKAMVDNYYVTSPQDVVITEINVDSLTSKEVSVAHDGNVKNVAEGRGYQVSDLTNNKGWHSISYTVNASNFKKDGMYSVTVFSEDKATNKQSNQSKDAEVKFLMDATAPSVVVSGLDDEGVYEEASHDFSVNAADTMGVEKMSVLLNGDKLGEYSAKELSENGGTVVLTIPSKDDYQKVEIICSDIAGNKTNLVYNNILVSEKAEELLISDNLTPTTGDNDAKAAVGTSVINNISKVIAIVGIIVAIVMIGAVVVITNRKKANN